MRQISLLVILLTFITTAFCQTPHNMTPGTVNFCGQPILFYDTGGPTGQYGTGESIVETFCSSNPAASVAVTFSSFVSEATFDALIIYSGPSTSGLQLAQLDGSNASSLIGQVISSSAGDCLTFEWVSDNSITYAGWVATINCTFPCQPFSVNITNSNIPIDTLRICQNTSLTLDAIGTYGPAVNYPQADNTTTFTWNYGDGSAPASGVGMSSVTHIWPEGAFYVVLSAKDISNCPNSNLARIMVIVSTTPTFLGTNLSQDTICPGEPIVLDGQHVQSHPWSQSVDTMVAGLTYLPDGTNSSYESSISNTLFTPGQAMASVSDITSICLNMEHSYLGDLSINIICPNGQTMSLHNYSGGGSTILGEPVASGLPVDDNTVNSTPGIGYTYCFEPGAANGTLATSANWVTVTPYTDPIGQVSPTAVQVPAGSYQAAGSWNSLLNCPLNGQWTIQVEDHMGADNGYIFWWGMNFNPPVIPPQFTFENQHDSTMFSWLGSDITSQNNGLGNATPVTPGTNVYTFEVIDDFGCTYDTTTSVYVRAINSPMCCVQPIPFAGNNDTVCSSSYMFQATLGANHVGVWSVVLPAPGTATIASPASQSSLVTVNQFGTYYFVWTESVSGQATCLQRDTVAITFYQTPTSTFTKTPILCYGDSTVITYTGNTVAPALFDWQIGGLGIATPSINTTYSGPYKVVWSVAGTYDVSLQVTQNGCTSTITTVPVLTPQELQHTSTLVQNPCYGNAMGSITIVNTGGTLPYTYTWNSVVGTSILGNLAAGTYSLSVYDANSCSYNDSFIITEPPPLTADTAFKNIACFGGNDGFANISVFGGTGIYIYTWNPAQSNTSSLTSLTANTYQVTVADANGCSLNETFVLNQPTQLHVTGSNDTSICFASSRTLQSSCTGGITPYTYMWNGVSGTNTSLTVTPVVTTDYFVQIKDAHNCLSNVVNMEVIVSPHMSATLAVTNNKCFNSCDGVANYTVSGGILPLIYSWPSENNVLSNLCVGSYTVTVTDQIGCSIDTLFDVTQPALLQAISSSTPTTCYGSGDGSAEVVTVQGGTIPYTYSWSNGSSLALADYLFAGVYSCQVRDAQGCVYNLSETVTEPPKVYVTATDDQTICIGGSTDISAQAMGGAYPYIYFWKSDSMTYLGSTIHVAPLQTTNYNLTVTDANGCKGNLQAVKVNVLPPLSIDSYTIDDTICPGEAANIRVTVSGGSGGPYRIYLNNGTIVAPPFDVYPLQSQTYTMIAYDKCETPPIKDSVLVHVLPIPLVSPQVSIFKGCVPLSVSFIESSLDSGQTYLWRFGEGMNSEGSLAKNPTHIFQYPGTYLVTLTVTSIYGCSKTDTINTPIDVYSLPDARFVLDPQVVSIADPQVIFTNLSVGADTSYWSFGDGDSSMQTSPTHYYHSIGTYKVDLIASTSHNCTDVVSETVSVKEEFTVFAPTAFSPNNDGMNDYFTVSGNGIHPDGYNLLIYNRWGEIIFSSKEKDSKWDGKYKGKVVEAGSYPWVLYYKNTNGINYQKSGIVTVLR